MRSPYQAKVRNDVLAYTIQFVVRKDLSSAVGLAEGIAAHMDALVLLIGVTIADDSEKTGDLVDSIVVRLMEDVAKHKFNVAKMKAAMFGDDKKPKA